MLGILAFYLPGLLFAILVVAPGCPAHARPRRLRQAILLVGTVVVYWMTVELAVVLGELHPLRATGTDALVEVLRVFSLSGVVGVLLLVGVLVAVVSLRPSRNQLILAGLSGLVGGTLLGCVDYVDPALERVLVGSGYLCWQWGVGVSLFQPRAVTVAA